MSRNLCVDGDAAGAWENASVLKWEYWKKMQNLQKRCWLSVFGVGNGVRQVLTLRLKQEAMLGLATSQRLGCERIY